MSRRPGSRSSSPPGSHAFGAVPCDAPEDDADPKATAAGSWRPPLLALLALGVVATGAVVLLIGAGAGGGAGRPRSFRAIVTLLEDAAGSGRQEEGVDRVPTPPVPYDYETFVPWFKAQPWKELGLRMPPSLGWFDVDTALEGKFQPQLEERDIHRVVAIAKAINRFLFMREIMESGDDSTQASLGMHLLMLTYLQEKLASPEGVAALDIGCGTGWLLEAFALMSNNTRSNITGIDLDIEAATKVLADPNVASFTTMTPAPKVFKGNLLEEHFGVDGATEQRFLQPGSFDVVNVGVAIASVHSPIFAKVFGLLRNGGVLTAPICEEADVDPHAGKCGARFQKFQRDARGTPLPLASAGGITFILPE